jgi:hypothetical protein
MSGLQRRRVVGIVEMDVGARRPRLVFVDHGGGGAVDEREPRRSCSGRRYGGGR